MRRLEIGLGSWLLVIGVALSLVGCAGSTTPTAGPGSIVTGTPKVSPSWESCDEAVPPQPGLSTGADALNLPRLAPDFTPVAVTICGTQPQRAASGGEDLLATERRSDSVAALVAALRLPDETRTQGACTMDLPMVPWFALHDAQGRWVRPGVPADACGKIRVEVRTALQELALTTVSSRKVGEIESADAAAAGCGQRWADMIAASLSMGASMSPASYQLTAAAEVRLCVYRVPADQQGSGKPAGEFVKGGVLRPASWAAIHQALPTPLPAKPCTTPANRFALLGAVNANTDHMYVELDGCRRLMTSLSEVGPAGSSSSSTAATVLGLSPASPALITAIEQALD